MLLSVQLVHSQNIGSSYQEHINIAELSIVNLNYKQALEQYAKAFDTKVDFTSDLYNACILAIKLNRSEKIFEYAEKLALKGVGEKFFTKSIFKDFLKDKKFNAIVAKAEIIKNQNQIRNNGYNAKLKTIISNDSLYNELRLTKFRSSYPLPDTLKNLFEQNTQRLVQLIKEEGYYSENKLGAAIYNDTLVAANSRANIVFLHYLGNMGNGGNEKTISDIKRIVTENLTSGRVKPHQMKTIIEYNHLIFGDIGAWNFKIYNCQIYKKKIIEDIEKFNFYRNLYCMDSIEDFEKKAVYAYSVDSDFYIIGNIIKAPVHDTVYFESAFQSISDIKNCEKN